MRPERASWVAGLVAGLLGLSGLRCLDVWMHLRTGAVIWQTGAIPRTDSLSHTRPGAPWVTHEWGFELPLYGIWQLGGDPAMVLVQAGLAAVAFTLLARAAREAGAGPTAAAASAIFGAAVAATRFLPRPHMLSAVLTALLLILGIRAMRAPGRGTWWAIPVILVWANVHAGVVVGLLILAAFAAEEALRLRRPGPVAGITLVASLVSVLNPNGPATLWYPFFLIQSNDAGLFDILELRRPDWPSPVHAWIAAFLLALPFAWRRAGLALVGLGALGAVLGATRIRASLDAVLLGAPVVAIGLSAALARLAARAPVPAPLGATLLGATLLGSMQWRPSLEVDPWAIPAGAMRFVADHDVRGQMLNAHAFGAWLLWAWPDRPVFFDGRNEVFVDLFREVDQTDIDRLAERYDLGYALVEYPSDRDVREVDIPVDITDQLLTNPHWSLLYFDDVARLYVRDRPENHALVEARAYRLLRPGWSDFTYLQRHAAGPTAAALEAEARRAVGEAPDAALPRMHLVEFLRLSGRVDEALAELDAIASDDPFVLSRRGALLLQAGRVGAAREALEAAAAALPENAAIWSNLGLARMKGLDPAGAAEAFRAAIARDPDLVEARRNLAMALRQAGDIDGAAAESARAETAAAELARTHFEAGQQLLSSGYAERAAVELERAAQLSPANANVRYLLGVAYNVAGEPARADVELRRCLGLDPAHPYALLELADAKRALGVPAEARELLAAFLSTGPEEKWAQLARRKLAELGPGEEP